MASAPVVNVPALKASEVKVHQLIFGIERTPAIIKEDSTHLIYSAPFFRARATFEVPKLPVGEKIQIGWIQVCTDMDVVSVYDDQGIGSWEIPEFVSGQYEMLNDSAGSMFPWHGSTTEVVFLQGPTNDTTVGFVHMNDALKNATEWVSPADVTPKEPRLSFVYRKQHFYTYLILYDFKSHTYQIMKAIKWSMEIAIDVNVKNPVGSRAKLIGSFVNDCPTEVPEHLAPPIKCYAFRPPACNTGQALMWRPYDGEIKVIIEPQVTTVDMNNYALHSDVHTKKLMLITKENYLKGKV